MLNNLLELNEKFFELYGNIRENTENLTREQLDFMHKKLFEQYKIEYSKIALDKEREDKSVLTYLKLKFGGIAPFKFLFIKNEAYKLLRERVNKEIDEIFESEIKELNSSSISEEPLRVDNNSPVSFPEKN